MGEHLAGVGVGAFGGLDGVSRLAGLGLDFIFFARRRAEQEFFQFVDLPGWGRVGGGGVGLLRIGSPGFGRALIPGDDRAPQGRLGEIGFKQVEGVDVGAEGRMAANTRLCRRAMREKSSVAA
jgi:hypothetical protein